MNSGPCLDGLSLALSQINCLIADLTKKNFKSNVTEVKNLVYKFGTEAERHLLLCLFAFVEKSLEKAGNKETPQLSLLVQEFQDLVTKPNFVSIVCNCFEKVDNLFKANKPSPSFFHILKILRLTKVQEVVLGIALQSSENLALKSFAHQFLKQKLPDLLKSYIESDIGSSQESIGLSDVAIEVLHLLLTFISSCSKDSLNIKPEDEVAFLDSLRRDFPKERVPVVLAPLLYKEERDQEEVSFRLNLDPGTMPRSGGDTKLCDIMEEIGYLACKSREECKETLSRYGLQNITSQSVARVLGMMGKTLSGLDSTNLLQSANGSHKRYDDQSSAPVTWNVEVFVDSVKELVPNLNWKQVIFDLDYPGFLIKSPDAIRLIVMAYLRATNDIFPVEAVYKAWNNTYGQLTWIENALCDISTFCFADYPCRCISLDILKSPPDESNKDVMTWRSLDLMEALLRLSEAEHYEAVLKLFAFPVKNCPDVLLLSLLQANATWHTLRNDLVSMLMPLFLRNHPNSMSVLHYAWNGQGQLPTIRHLVMQAMADWYTKSDMKGDQVEQQTKLSRILDVAQDLKAFSMLLNSTQFSFVIDLAALASRRKYLNLDKWLNDKYREHQEQFANALVSFLKRRCPHLIGVSPEKEVPKAVQLPEETISTILSCLQLQIAVLNPEVANTLKTMLANHGPIQKTRPNPLTMPPKRPGIDNGLGTPPLSGGQIDPFTSFGSTGQSTTPLTGFGSHPLAGTPLGASSTFSGLGSLSSTIQPPKQGQSPGGMLSGSNGNPASGAYNNPIGSSGISSGANFLHMLQQGSAVQSGGGLLSNSPIDTLQSLPSSVGSIGPLKRAPPTQSTLGGFSSYQQQQQQQQQPQQQAASLSQNRQQVERLKQVATGDLSAIFPGMDQNFSKEIEDESNTYFQRIYNQPPGTAMSIDEVLDMLKKFKDATSKKERDVFLCMLRNLFEEYRFFPHYPEKELHITACLFGGIIEQGLVTYMALGVALRYVLEALRKPPGSKMYMFGTTALDRFKTRLKDYPHYCQHLASIPHFKEFPPHLVDYIVFGQRSQEPPSASRNIQSDSPLFGGRPASGSGKLTGFSSSSPTPGQQNTLLSSAFSSSLATTSNPSPVSSIGASSSGTKTTAAPVSTASTEAAVVGSSTTRKEPSIANTTNIDTLLGATEQAEIKQPTDNAQDKIHFIFNNISNSNMSQKADELKQLIKPEHYPWLAQYFVMKRVSIEPNFHQLYTDFLKSLDISDLTKQVIQETFRNIKVLLRSDKGPANFSDRSLLKNLGHWLGMQSLGCDKPILYEDLELKSLVIEAFFKGQQELLYVVPFVAKVLESCGKSKVFKPPNPWLMGVMSVLSELHQMTEIKLNLKFEVEVLCQTLNLELKDLRPADLLKDREVLNKIDHQLTLPEKEKLGTDGSHGSAMLLPPPLFSYQEINVSAGIAGLAPFIQINQNIPLFQQYPHLRQCIRPAIERAVQELLSPVVDRCIKICLTTVEMIVKKDFSLDPEESRTRTAAHHMARNITAGMAMITCREPLQQSLNSHIKSNLLATLRGANAQQKEQLEHVATDVANDNLELACAFIQKSSVEKCLLEIDKRLLSEYELRKMARTENRRYCDTYALTYQAERMPEQIRMKVGGVTSNQMNVYEEFAKSIPGFLPPEATGAPEPFPKPLQEQIPGLFGNSSQEGAMPDDVVHILGKCAAEIEQHIHHMEQTMHQMMVPPPNPHLAQLHNLLDMVVNARVIRDNASAILLIRKAVEGILETVVPADTEMALRYKDCHLIVLRGFQDPRGYGPLWTARQVLRVLAELPQEVKFNIEGIDILIRAHLINVGRDFDPLLAQWIDGGQNFRAVNFAMQLCRLYLIDEKNRAPITMNDLSNTYEALYRVSQSRQGTEGLSSLLDSVHPQASLQSSGFMGHYQSESLEKGSSMQGAPTSLSQGLLGHDFEDPPGLYEKVDYLLKEWVRLYHHASAGRYSEKAFQAFVPQLHHYGILKTDDLITRFFRLCTEICVNITYKALNEYVQNPSQARTKCFTNTDAYCRLISLLVKHSGDSQNNVTKINLLNRVLGIIGNVLLQDHEVRKADFHQLPYQRMFVILLLELNAPDPVLEAINYHILSCFGTVLHDLRPSRASGFAYAWLELVSHRTLMSKLLLNSPQQKGWVIYHQLLVELFKFLAPFLRNVELAKQTHLLYKGTLRVLLVLLHDFPEFLCDYHFSFCDVIPPNCIQMRNLILSAFPRNMRLPDPFTPNLKVDLLSDIARAPRILTNFAAAIQPASFKKDLDSYLKTRAPVTFLSELRSFLQVSNEPGTRYNVALMNALVLYVGTQAIAYIQSKSGTPSISTITHSSHMDIFQNLAVDLDTEGRYLFLNAIANQLRYPNSHTHYFSCTLLYLFAEANSEAIQEQITRVLLERLIVNRPHPWGLLITFIELIKNHNYKFWNHDFVHCAPEIEKLFESVARSCMQQKQPSRNGNEAQE